MEAVMALRFFSNVRGFALIAMPAALVACGGLRGSAPLAPLAGGARPLAGACYTHAQQPHWIFRGACVMSQLTPAGGEIRLPAYKGIGVSIRFPATTLKKAVAVTAADATGNGDISAYQGKAFPRYRGKGTAVIYLQSVSHTTHEIPVKAASSLAFAVTASHFPGTTCKLAVWAGTAWVALPIQAAPKNGRVTIVLPGRDISSIAPGASYSVLACS
jgi:hypothetical protein